MILSHWWESFMSCSGDSKYISEEIVSHLVPQPALFQCYQRKWKWTLSIFWLGPSCGEILTFPNLSGILISFTTNDLIRAYSCNTSLPLLASFYSTCSDGKWDRLKKWSLPTTQGCSTRLWCFSVKKMSLSDLREENHSRIVAGLHQHISKW